MDFNSLKTPMYTDAVADWLQFEKMIQLLRDKLKGEAELTFEKIQDAFAEISDGNEQMTDCIQRFFLEFVKVNLQ